MKFATPPGLTPETQPGTRSGQPVRACQGPHDTRRMYTSIGGSQLFFFPKNVKRKGKMKEFGFCGFFFFVVGMRCCCLWIWGNKRGDVL